MKGIRELIFGAVIITIMSCSNDIDDKLDGRWQLQKVEGEGSSFVVDTVFYNFQTSLFMYQIYQPATNSFRNCYGFKTVEDGKQLALELVPYGTIVPASFIANTDWTATQKSFVIEQINASRLVLKSDSRKYTFRKF